MIKLKNAYLIGIMTASLLVGCGGGGDSEANEGNEGTEQQEHNGGGSDDASGTTNESVEGNNGNGSGTNTPPPAASNAKTFSADVMPVLNTKCKSCHGSNGNFTITTPSATYANISDLKASVPEAGKYLLDKGSNTVGHGGGVQITTTSAEYTTIKSWVDAGADLN